MTARTGLVEIFFSAASDARADEGVALVSMTMTSSGPTRKTLLASTNTPGGSGRMATNTPSTTFSIRGGAMAGVEVCGAGVWATGAAASATSAAAATRTSLRLMARHLATTPTRAIGGPAPDRAGRRAGRESTRRVPTPQTGL